MLLLDDEMNLLLGSGEKWQDIAIPDAAFSWMPCTVERIGNLIRPKNFNLRTHANITVAKTYWVKAASEGGSDAANGLSEATAFASIHRGLSRADVDRVMVKGAAGAGAIYGITTYPSSHSWNNNSPARNIEVIAYGGRVISTSSIEFTSLSWGPVDSHYEASYAQAIDRVRDLANPDAFGDASTLTLGANAAAVDATAGTWYYDATADIIYVHTIDSRAPDANILCFIGVNQCSINDAVKYYVEGIEFWGGSNAFNGNQASTDCKAYFKNCEFKYSTGDTFTVVGMGEVILQNCTIAKGEADSVHLAVSGATAGNLLMIDCTLRNCGLVGATNSNAYSRHGPGSTVIIGGEMYACYGPIQNDITDGTTLWCIGTYAHDPVSATSRFGFGVQDNSTAWLDSCRTTGCPDGDVRAFSATSEVYYRNHTPSPPTAATGSGTVTAY